MRSKRLRAPGLLVLSGLLAALLFVTNFLPLARLLVRALSPAALGWLATSTQARTALVHSLSISTTVAVAATLLALGLALLLEKTDLPGRATLRVLLFVPLVIPPQILTIAWLGWAGPAGYLQRWLMRLFDVSTPLWTLYGPGGIVTLLTLFALPVAYLAIATGLTRVPRSLEEAAQLDGSSPPQTWRFIVVPLLIPNLLAALMLSFLAALGNFGIQALLGIPARYLTLPTLIYQQVVSFASGGFDHAAALALLLGVPALLALILQTLTLRRRETRLEGLLEPPLRYHLGPVRWSLSGAVWLVVAGLVTLGPFLSMLLTALLRAYGVAPRLENLTFSHFVFVLTELGSFRRALTHSFLLASGAAVIAAGLALVLGYLLLKLRGKWALPLQLLVDLPYALPGLVFALALILVWLRSPIPGVKLYGTLYLLLLAYVGHYLAFALQPVGAAWRQLDSSLEEAARMDGAGLLATLRYIFAPLLAPSLGAAALLVFLNAFTELSLSALLAGSRSETLGWLVFGLEQAGSTNAAAALSTILVVILALLALAVTLLRGAASKVTNSSP